MAFIEFEYNDSELREKLESAYHNIYKMVQTMKDVASLVEANTYMKVPLKTGALQESFHPEFVRLDSDFIQVNLVFDVADPKTGFHYAEIQHQNTRFHHPRRGQAFYLYYGIQASRSMAYSMIEKDYLSLFIG